MDKKWKLKEQPDNTQVVEFAKQLGIHEKLSMLLIQRGIDTKEKADSFFEPKLDDLHDPFLMKDMDRAVVRIEKAIDNGEKVLVYGDYDVDGTTAVAIVYSHLQKYIPQERLGYYVPERYTEGYGISEKGVNYAAEEGFTLVIALDCGIKAVERMQYAKSKGVDFIICDHHTPGDEMPEAIAVIDSKRSDCSYPDKNLSGCGVGFKLMQALNKHQGRSPEELYNYLDILAVSIASDIVPMTGENRILAFHGLKKINQDPSVGLRSILRVADLEKKRTTEHSSITISDIVFKIGPRINAAGRMSSGKEAVRLLVSTSDADVLSVSEDIDKSNKDRMELDRQTTEEAKRMIQNDPEYKHKNTTVLYNPEWMKGIVGIVASRLTEEFYRPTIVLTQSQGLVSGSARSVEGFDLYGAIDACSDLLKNFGGHMYAAGLTLEEKNVEEFKRRFEEIVSKSITPEQKEPQVEIDCSLDLGDITPEFYNMLKRFEPFGPGNPMPTFQTMNVYDRGGSRRMGKDMSHLRLEVIDTKSNNTMLGVAFGKGDMFDRLLHCPFHLCYNIDENFWAGKTSLQLMVKDIKVD